MPDLNQDILHRITKALNPRDLLRFHLTSKNAESIIGPPGIKNMKRWLRLWNDEFGWADEVLSHGQVPILVFLGSYGHLLMATPKDKAKSGGLSNNRVAQKDITTKIKQSLLSSRTAQHELEIQFDGFRLDISHILFASIAHASREIFHNGPPKQLEVAVYQGETHVVTPVLKRDDYIIIEIPGFTPITLLNQSVGEDPWHLVAHSLDYCTKGTGCNLGYLFN